MENFNKEAREASLLLSNRKLPRKEFSELYTQWENQTFDWRVHLGLIMSPAISKTEFLHLAERHSAHNIMNEEVLAQMSRFDIEKETREQLLFPFLPEHERRSSTYAAEWTVLEQTAMGKI